MAADHCCHKSQASGVKGMPPSSVLEARAQMVRDPMHTTATHRAAAHQSRLGASNEWFGERSGWGDGQIRVGGGGSQRQQRTPRFLV